MGANPSLFAIALFTLGLSLFPSNASGITLQYLSSADEVQTLLPNPAFVAEGQIGIIALNKHSEFDSNPPKAENTESQIDFAWSNGNKQPFSLIYDGSTVRYTVGSETLESEITGSFTDIFLSTRATEKGSSTLLDSLQLKDSSMTLFISSLVASETTGGQTIWRIYDIDSPFTLTGNATLSWMETPQSSSNIAYQIQVGSVDPPKNMPEPSPVPDIDAPKNVPEPSSVAALTFGTAILAFCTHRRS